MDSAEGETKKKKKKKNKLCVCECRRKLKGNLKPFQENWTEMAMSERETFLPLIARAILLCFCSAKAKQRGEG